MGHRVLTYVSGPHAAETARLLNQKGMNLKVVGDQPGQASAIKLLVSIVTKGLEALLVEMLLASHHYRVEEHVLFALKDFFSRGLDSVVDRLFGSDAVHAGRRVNEMESAVRVLQDLRIDPIMVEATVQRLKWSASLGLGEHFGGITPAKYGEVIQAWEKIGLFSPSR